jgi:hypothetical protein
MCDETNQKLFIILPQGVYDMWQRGEVRGLKNPILAEERDCGLYLATLPNAVAVELNKFRQTGEKGLRDRMRQAVAV